MLSPAEWVRYVSCLPFYVWHALSHSLLWDHGRKEPLSFLSFAMKLSADRKKSELTHILPCFFLIQILLFPRGLARSFKNFMGEARATCWEGLYVWVLLEIIALPQSVKWSSVWKVQLFKVAVFTFTKMSKHSLVTEFYTHRRCPVIACLLCFCYA